MKWVDYSTGLPWDSGLVDKYTTQAAQVCFTSVIEWKRPEAKALLKLFIFPSFLAKTPQKHFITFHSVSLTFSHHFLLLRKRIDHD